MIWRRLAHRHGAHARWREAEASVLILCGSRRTRSIPDVTVAALHRQQERIQELKAFLADDWMEGDFVFASTKALIKLTMDTYGHLFEGSDREAADHMDRLFGSKRPAQPDSGKVVPLRRKAKA